MDIQNSPQFLKRLIIVTSIIFILGLLFFFLSAKPEIGIALFLGGVIGVVFGIVLYFKIKDKDKKSVKKIFALFYIISGSLLLLLVLLGSIFEKESSRGFYFEFGISLFFLIYGTYYYVKNK